MLAHDHARWLNLANRLCRAWCSEHTLPSNADKNLKLLVEFIVGVYSSLWFEIKVKHGWIEGPYHILKQLQLVSLQPKKYKILYYLILVHQVLDFTAKFNSDSSVQL